VELRGVSSNHIKKEPMYEDFYQLLDQIYWDGYAEQLAFDNPEKLTFELNQFLNN
jgi:hypothetical protein